MEDHTPPQPPDSGIGLDHVSIRSGLIAANLVDSWRQAQALLQPIQEIWLCDGLDGSAHPTRTHHEGKPLGQVAQHLERRAPGADDHGRTELDNRDSCCAERRSYLLATS